MQKEQSVSAIFVSFERILVKICRISTAWSNHDSPSSRFSSVLVWSGPIQLCIWKAFWITRVYGKRSAVLLPITLLPERNFVWSS